MSSSPAAVSRTGLKLARVQACESISCDGSDSFGPIDISLELATLSAPARKMCKVFTFAGAPGPTHAQRKLESKQLVPESHGRRGPCPETCRASGHCLVWMPWSGRGASARIFAATDPGAFAAHASVLSCKSLMSRYQGSWMRNRSQISLHGYPQAEPS